MDGGVSWWYCTSWHRPMIFRARSEIKPGPDGRRRCPRCRDILLQGGGIIPAQIMMEMQ